MSELLEFNIITIRIPRKMMLCDLKKNVITRKSSHKYFVLRKRMEIISYKVAHVNSVLDRLLLKTHEYRV